MVQFRLDGQPENRVTTRVEIQIEFDLFRLHSYHDAPRASECLATFQYLTPV